MNINSFEECDIDEEFKDTKDCMFIEFDEEFPLNPPITDPDERAEEIYRILK